MTHMTIKTRLQKRLVEAETNRTNSLSENNNDAVQFWRGYHQGITYGLYQVDDYPVTTKDIVAAIPSLSLADVIALGTMLFDQRCKLQREHEAQLKAGC